MTDSGWTWLQLRLVVDDLMLWPVYGPGDLTQDAAHTAIRDQLAALPGAESLVAVWDTGAKDHTVYARTSEGTATWAILPHDDAGPRPAVHAWIEEYAATLRGTGLAVTVADEPQ
jgi:hypothetical protein